MTQETRLHRLQAELLEILPESAAWIPQSHRPEIAPSNGDREYWFEVPSPRSGDRHLVVLLRRDGDVQVEYHIAGRQGSPFECLFLISANEEDEALREVARLVEGLLTERVVLALEKGFWRGGRKFVEAAQLTERERRKLSWITSWHGTYDWPTR